MRVTFVWLLVWVLVSACSASESSGPEAPLVMVDGGSRPDAGVVATDAGRLPDAVVDAGGNPNVDAGADAGGHAGFVEPTPTTEQEACVGYFRARENRIERTCVDLPAQSRIVGIPGACPEYLFADGSTFDLQKAVACIEAWQSFDCARALSGQVPEGCEIAGDRVQGAPCWSDVQCQSGRCDNYDVIPGCAICARIVAPGESCDGHGVACPQGMYCVEGACIDEPPWGVFEPRPLGAQCSTDADCGQGIYDPSDSRCLMDPEQPEQGARCTKAPSVGERCGLFGTNNQICQYGSSCEMGVCRAWPVAGAPCFHQEAAGPFCADGFYCRLEPEPICADFKSVGEPCETETGRDYSYECGGMQASNVFVPRSCTCEDPATCTTRQCHEGRFTGERCDEPNTYCVFPDVCNGTHCVHGPDFELNCLP